MNKHDTLDLPKRTYRRAVYHSVSPTHLALSVCRALDAFKYKLSLAVNNNSIWGHLKQRPHQHRLTKSQKHQDSDP